jgi:cytochrome oxidase Cu insertion factor (SCO1/SenC/PrrC family)
MMTTNRSIVVLAATVLILGAWVGSAEGDSKMIPVGEKFVEFNLPAHDGTSVDSRDLGGKPYLLFFYIKADTPG